MMGVGVGQASGVFDTPHGIESANHMSAIENGGDIEFRAIYLCRLGNAGVCLPPRTLETEKGGAAVDVHARDAAKTTGSAHDNAEIFIIGGYIPGARGLNLPEKRASRWGESLTTEKMSQCRWINPKLVCQVAFLEWTDAGHLRHCIFVGMRDDKEPAEVVRET